MNERTFGRKPPPRRLLRHGAYVIQQAVNRTCSKLRPGTRAGVLAIVIDSLTRVWRLPHCWSCCFGPPVVDCANIGEPAELPCAQLDAPVELGSRV